ncbi:MAG TPA: OmpA family protein [Chitinophagaceae bacterium]|nr:OmpA family protein [Chitinophagaceae bacterium]
MKKILAIVLALSAFRPSGFGQDDEIRPAAIGISFFLQDFATAERIRSTSLSSVMANKKWAKPKEMAPGIAIHYFKGLTKRVDFAGTLAGSFVKYPFPKHTPFTDDNFLLAADASVQLKLVPESFWVQPYLNVGVGGHMYKGSYFGAFIPLGAGFKINFYDDAHLFFNTQYRVPVTNETSNYHFIYQIGVAGRIGEKKAKVIVAPKPDDTDKDGIPDNTDKCPTVPGLAKYEGCPIPDTDKDGINDEEDKCPTVFGLARYQGCPIPDTDKDGINDEDDKCPTVAGLARYQGCPLVDTDNDGVPDEEDKCPTVPGPKENNGCPEIKADVVKKVDYAANNILFATNRFVLLAGSFKGLNEVAKILKDNPDLKMSIDGYTDNVGDETFNQKLSENRANAVKKYLVKQGVDESRLTATGHGESNPVADNKTSSGREKNRRVEMKLAY